MSWLWIKKFSSPLYFWIKKKKPMEELKAELDKELFKNLVGQRHQIPVSLSLVKLVQAESKNGPFRIMSQNPLSPNSGGPYGLIRSVLKSVCCACVFGDCA